MLNRFLISIGGNIKNPDGLHPIQTFQKVIEELKNDNIILIAKSEIFLSEPVPKSQQPNYYNLVLLCKSNHMAGELLNILLKKEKKFGRIRYKKNMSRCLDLDLINFDNRVRKSLKLIIPHPRMHLRKFVLLPLKNIDPGWIHPLFKKNIFYYLKKISKQKILKIKKIDFST